MDRHAGHRSVDGVVVERERLRPGVDHRRRPGRPLRTHGRARLDGQDPSVDGLVGPRAGANIEDGLGVAETGMDQRRYSRVGAAVMRIGAPVLLVVNARTQVDESLPPK